MGIFNFIVANGANEEGAQNCLRLMAFIVGLSDMGLLPLVGGRIFYFA